MAKTRRGMMPNEIRAEMVLRGVKMIDIARRAKVTSGAVHQTINCTGYYKGYRIRPYIADAIGKPVDEIWPPKMNSEKD